MKVLVLGGDGFLGSHFVDAAICLGHDVTVFDRFPFGISRNLEELSGKIRLVSGEFANRDDLSSVLQGHDIVYHFVCASNPAESWNDPILEIEENLRMTVQFFELAVKHEVKKVVFPSSGGTVYGLHDGLLSEDVTPRPFSPHGIAKLSAEHFLNYFRAHNDIAADVYRIGNPFGPRQATNRHQGVIAVWMKAILDSEEITVYGGETTLRDYVYVEDVARLMTHSLLDVNASDTYNLGSGKGLSTLELLEKIASIVDMPIKRNMQPQRSQDNRSVILDTSKLLKQFSSFEYHDVDDALAKTWEYYRSVFPHNQ